MTELIFGLTILALCALVAYEKHEHKKTVDKLTNALVSRSAQDLRTLDMVDKIDATPKPMPEIDPALIPLSDLDDEEFDKRVLGK